MTTKAELRKSILDLFNPASPQDAYLQSLFDLEDANEGKAIEYGARISALEYASKLGTTVNTEVLSAANAYLAFLKGEVPEDSETKPKG